MSIRDFFFLINENKIIIDPKLLNGCVYLNVFLNFLPLFRDSQFIGTIPVIINIMHIKEMMN